MNFIVDFSGDLIDLLNRNMRNFGSEPEYDNFVKCFDQGLSEDKINQRYDLVELKKFKDRSQSSSFGLGNVH